MKKFRMTKTNNNKFEVVRKASKEFRKRNPTIALRDPWNHGLNLVTMKQPENLIFAKKPSCIETHSISLGKINGANV